MKFGVARAACPPVVGDTPHTEVPGFLASPLVGEVAAKHAGGGGEQYDRSSFTPHPARKAEPTSPTRGEVKTGRGTVTIRRDPV